MQALAQHTVTFSRDPASQLEDLREIDDIASVRGLIQIPFTRAQDIS